MSLEVLPILAISPGRRADVPKEYNCTSYQVQVPRKSPPVYSGEPVDSTQKFEVCHALESCR
jgi:hypothetical protein